MSNLVESLRDTLYFISDDHAALCNEAADELERLTNQLFCATDILQSLFPLHRMVTDQHADKHDAVPIGWTIDLGTIRRASKFIIAQVSQSDDQSEKSK